MNRLVIALKALRQLGLQQVGLYALYKFGLAAGHYQRATAGRPLTINHLPSPIVCHPLFDLPARADLLAVLGSDGKTALLAEADEIIAGKVRLFGADPAPLQLAVPGKLTHWTAYETGRIPLTINHLPIPDIKFVWEPARFGWAFTLGRAFRVTGGEKYAEAFWKYFETFTDANPPCLGPHWMSGQEVALRLMAFAWAGQVFDAAPASTPERKRRLADSVAAHAARIPPTLIYARSQHNNHLLAESAGLLTAGLALPEHPESARWQRLGQMWLDHGFRSQIDAYGEYAQRSANYHRLMLQVALWVRALTTKGTKEHKGKNQVYRSPTTYHPRRGPVVGAVQSLETLDSAPLSPSYMKKISAATHWLLSLMDSESGRTPNLGANDGAYIFPLTICPFSDYRPVAHAAARAFLDYELPRGPWDEMALWFGAQARTPRTLALPRYPGDQIYGKDSWAYLRTAQFTSRPSHADQLHLDLWWRGLNIAQDAGAYLYNAPAPWDNSLTTALVHNTVTVNGRDQFARAGRFLYLDWFDAYRTSEIAADPQILQQVSGRYRARGFRHTRAVSALADGRWRVTDEILRLRVRRKPFTARIHWLLPDWEWKMEDGELEMVLRLVSPQGPLVLIIHHLPFTTHSGFSLFRAGELLRGSADPDPVRGWVSPTYGVKIPALSLAVIAQGQPEISFSTEFAFPPLTANC